jgi:hypothetical protein
MGHRLIAMASILVLLAPVALAQGPVTGDLPAGAESAGAAAPGPDRGILAAIRPDSLVGMPVLSSDGAEVGAVAEVTAPEAGAARILVATDGLLGIGGKTVALDPSRLTLDRQAGSVVVDLTADQVASLPEYEG